MTLMVYPRSYLTVRNFVDALKRLLESRVSTRVELKLAERMSEVEVEPGSVVLVVGFMASVDVKPKDARVVFVNFSVVYPVRGLLSASLSARRWMREKRGRFWENMPNVDDVIDFYPAHAAILSRKIGKPVEPFPTLLDVSGPGGNLDDCEYDVCVVGGTSARRQRVYDSLASRGWKLSPTRTEDFEGVVSNSRILLNVHQHRCDNCEAPRLLMGLAKGRCVVTEETFGLHEVVHPGVYESARYRGIVGAVDTLLGDRHELTRLASAGAGYFYARYRPGAESAWVKIMERLVR